MAQSRSERVDVRMTPDAKRTLVDAAVIANKTLGEFLLDSGLDAAAARLTDRRSFVLDDARWRAFMSELDKPPADNPALRRLLTRKPAWEG